MEHGLFLLLALCCLKRALRDVLVQTVLVITEKAEKCPVKGANSADVNNRKWCEQKHKV